MAKKTAPKTTKKTVSAKKVTLKKVSTRASVAPVTEPNYMPILLLLLFIATFLFIVIKKQNATDWSVRPTLRNTPTDQLKLKDMPVGKQIGKPAPMKY